MIINQIRLNPSSMARALGVVAFLLVLVSTGGQLTAYWTGHRDFYGLVQLFNLDAEQNIPTFFSTFLLLFAALLLAVIALIERNRGASQVSYWAILSFGVLLMAVDEFVCIHERLVDPVRRLLGGGHLGVFYFAWVIPGIALILLLAVFFLRFLLHLPAKTRLTFLLAGALYIGGAIGFELIEGRHVELHGAQNLTYLVIATIEESLEMAGVVIFIWALLAYIADTHKEVRFRLDRVRGQMMVDACPPPVFVPPNHSAGG
jgi:hypothetical protein